MWRPSQLIFCATALALLASVTTTVESASTNGPFYVIANMANSKAAINWAVSQGANAVKITMQIDASGRPVRFAPASGCDCACKHEKAYHICDHALYNSCYGNGLEYIEDVLRHIAKTPKILLVIVDNKLDAKLKSLNVIAGKGLVTRLHRYLFDSGYRGKVVISTSKFNSYGYIHAAVAMTNYSKYKSHFYFSFDQEGSNYPDVVAMLSRLTKNRVFGTGTTACAGSDNTKSVYKSGISQAVEGVRKGEISMSYMGTLDDFDSMNTYIGLGVHGIITNRVAMLWWVVALKGMKFAKSSDIFPPAIVDVSSPNKCNCDYHPGGCQISFPAPPNRACKCQYNGATTCGGSVVNCPDLPAWADSDREQCRMPQDTFTSCQTLGGGDCGGYRCGHMLC